ncbi:rhodanese-like domain-containing protein [Falsiroseomonas selenitidurans]|uniref:Thiosulfate sulfurtransferase n=1 Tax=Falsiroseomonas selenitidurans TaxID=2716335 RepID=A0ABX1E2D3_9PROT|nr:rhodanese-like domain-containing protein [Falsiroseomonas selenitidurans]NKC29922.1 thiosulfate sulfurtransferase [Falsiroseomonas selenitidurans]
MQKIETIEAAALKARLRQGGEIALLDAREEGEFSAAHLFWAVPCPLSQAEFRAARLLPRLDAPVVCLDGGEGHARRLAGVLQGLGYTQLSVLAGGTPAWQAAGYELFSGFNVPSKAFGEWVEHHYATPSVDAAELAAMQAAGEDLLVVDSRPMAEFRNMSIPGAIDVPGAELAYRVPSMLARPETTVVVNCAGRTRSILGAESLRRAGLPNRVVALRNGTMGWELAGLTCNRGREDRYAPGTPPDAAETLARARRFAEGAGVRWIDREGLAALRAEAGRSLYVLDVRDPAEFAEGHLPGSVSAPGGQLVQATDAWVAVRGARIVLVDDTGTRAAMTAGWLRQLGGWEVFCLTGGLAGALETGPAAPALPAALRPAVARVEVAALHRDGPVVVDLARSLAFRAGHIPGAIWGVRTRLALLLPLLAPGRPVVVTAPSEELAALGAAELAGLGVAPVAVLEGGNAAFVAAGGTLAADRTNPPDEACVDAWLRPYDRNAGVEAAMREYLAWEIDLVHAVERDGDAPFGAW